MTKEELKAIIKAMSKYATDDEDVKKAADRIVNYIIANYGDLLKRLAKE